MDNKIQITINGVDLGTINEKHIKKAYEKYGVNTPEQVALIYINKLIDANNELSVQEKMEKIVEKAKLHRYDTVAPMLVGEMIPDLRPSDEVCHKCKYYLKGFCAYDLCNVDPFDKGCKAWDEKLDKAKVTHIATGYIKK